MQNHSKPHNRVVRSSLLAAALACPVVAQNGDTEVVSTSLSGGTANADSFGAIVSSQGRFVVFQSSATDLVAGDTNNSQDIFWVDRLTGQTARASVAFDGSQANGSSFNGHVSDDGRYVLFESLADNLVPGDTNGVRDVFRRDMFLGTTTLVSLTSAGTQADASCRLDGISADGEQAVFFSFSTNLVPGAFNGWPQIYVRDITASATTHVSRSTSGVSVNPGQISSLFSEISADGNVVAFTSLASNVVAGDTNGAFDVFLHDRTTGVTTRASLTNAGNESVFGGSSPSLSADGSIVVFSSISNDLVLGDTNGFRDVFVRDTNAGTTTRISVSLASGQGNEDSSLSRGNAISYDGRFITFMSDASNLDSGDTNGARDIFVHDRNTGVTRRVSRSSAGVQGDSFSEFSRISGDGRFVTFLSAATNLVANDTNGFTDVFVHDRVVLQVDGCFGNSPSLLMTSPSAAINSTAEFLHVADSFLSGQALLYIGADARDAFGCGIQLPEGEILITPNGQPFSAPLVGGVAVISLPIPNNPSLIGAQTFVQSVGIDSTTLAIELANALRITISQ